MRDDTDILTFNNIVKDVRFTGEGEKYSERKRFVLSGLPKRGAGIENRMVDERSDDLQGGVLIIVIPSHIIDT